MMSEHQMSSPPTTAAVDYHELLEAIAELVCVVDEDGVVQYLNAAIEAILGAHATALIGYPVWRVVHPDEVGPLRRWLTQHLAGEGDTDGSMELRARHRDGTWRTVELCARPCHSPGADAALILIGRDITEQRCLEEHLRQSQKLEAVGLLASGIAHDFNNLLTGIKGYADLLLRDSALHESLRHDVQEIGKAAHRATGLTRQLLSFSRRQDLERQVIDPAAVLADLEQLLQRLINENIEIRARIPREIGWIAAERGQLEQVVINLAVNARDAMPDGGTLTLELDELALDDAAAPRYHPLQPGQYVRLRVADTGSGMDEETQRQIFQPFFTTKGPELGTGLGLSNVQAIVQRSGGAISVESAPGAGSTFQILLPRAQQLEPAAAPDALPRAARTRPGSETVLLVEDETVVRNLVQRVLRSRGYHVLTASDGAEARDLATAYQGEIHILVSDVVMPNLGGGELAEILLQSRPELRVLLISGHAADSIGPEIDGVRINFFAKPFTPDSLIRKVRDVLDADWGPVG